MNGGRVFNHRERWLLRKHIPGWEVLSGALVLAALAAMLVWVFAQKENFNPAERDLPYRMLAERPVEDRLYRRPLVRWRPPGAAVVGGGAPASRVDLGWFPPGVLSGGWALASRLRRFGKDTLFEKINGEAEKFLKQGFRELQYLSLKSTSQNGGEADELAIELFDQGTFAGALGIFSGHRAPGRPVQTEGGVMYFSTPAGAIGFHGRFFFRIAGNSSNAAIRDKAGQVVRSFAGLPVKEREPPPTFRMFTEKMGIDPSRVSFQQNNVFQYDFASNFWFAQPHPKRPMRFFLHRAESSAAAAKLFKAIADGHGQEFDVLQRTETAVVMRHPFLKTRFQMERSENLVFGLERGTAAERAGAELKRLASAMRKGSLR
ncbi:MAG: DUF6599 family protein [bacterium]